MHKPTNQKDNIVIIAETKEELVQLQKCLCEQDLKMKETADKIKSQEMLNIKRDMKCNKIFTTLEMNEIKNSQTRKIN